MVCKKVTLLDITELYFFDKCSGVIYSYTNEKVPRNTLNTSYTSNCDVIRNDVI